jgi:DNA-binding transcriptional regulator YiaG
MKKTSTTITRNGFALQLYTLRCKKGLSVREVAEILDFPHITVQQWDLGISSPIKGVQPLILEKLSLLPDATPDE